MVKRFFLFKGFEGRKVYKKDIQILSAYKKGSTDSLFIKILKNNMAPFFRVCRDLLWLIAGFKTKKLLEFLDEYNPQIVFLQSTNSLYSFSIAKWICLTRGIPLVMQTTDDYVTSKFTIDPFFWIQHYLLNNVYQWAVDYASCVIAIGDKMAAEYKLRFGGNYHVAMNTSDPLGLPEYKSGCGKINFLFAGNLGLNRWKLLSTIAESLEQLHNEEGLISELSIYSLDEPKKKILKKLNRSSYSRFKGAINNTQLNTIKSKMDILVHVEAFDKKNKHITRLSISTKIPEYLASGRCIFAVGPKDVASIQYLDDHDLGVTVTSENINVIKIALKNIIMNEQKRIYYSNKGIEVANRRHNARQTRSDVFDIIISAIQKKEKFNKIIK
jgi:hypothetical protein